MNLNFQNIKSIRNYGFVGFYPLNELRANRDLIPRCQGVYLIINNNKKVEFLKRGCGGFFKGKNPNVGLDILMNNYINGCSIIYIGKAGTKSGNVTLFARINQLLEFGLGRDTAHWGGRYIWQIRNPKNILLCWKTLPFNDARSEEIKLLQIFKDQFQKRPFANLRW